jgi:hypothetical protein
MTRAWLSTTIARPESILGARRQFAIDQLQFAGIDVELGGGGVFRCQALADRNADAGGNQRRRGDRDLPLPQQLRSDRAR